MVDRIEDWWSTQPKLIPILLAVLTLLLGLFLNGVRDDIASIKKDSSESRKEWIDLLKVLPDKYVSKELYLIEHENLKVMQDKIEKSLNAVGVEVKETQKQVAVSSDKLNEIRQDIKEHLKESSHAVSRVERGKGGL